MGTGPVTGSCGETRARRPGGNSGTATGRPPTRGSAHPRPRPTASGHRVRSRSQDRDPLRRKRQSAPRDHSRGTRSRQFPRTQGPKRHIDHDDPLVHLEGPSVRANSRTCRGAERIGPGSGVSMRLPRSRPCGVTHVAVRPSCFKSDNAPLTRKTGAGAGSRSKLSVPRPEPKPTRLHQVSGQRMRLLRTVMPRVVVQIINQTLRHVAPNTV